MENSVENLPFEEALAALQETVGKLEAGELTLEESLALFEQGQQLASRCTMLLDGANLRVEQLTADGEIMDVS